jgi:hypothetical protein
VLLWRRQIVENDVAVAACIGDVRQVHVLVQQLERVFVAEEDEALWEKST